MRLPQRMTTVVATVTLMVLSVVVQETSAARILVAVPVSTRSHGNFYLPIVEELAQRNHTVTYVTGYKTTTKHPNIRVVTVPDVNIFDNLANLFTTSMHTAFRNIYQDIQSVCIKALAYEGVQSLKNEKFDLLILYAAVTDCFLSFAHTQKIPFIYINPNKMLGVYAPAAGSPSFPSFNAHYALDVEYPLTFRGRMISSLNDLAESFYYYWILLPRLDAECRARQLCPKDMPSLNEFRLNGSLFITNSVATMQNPPLPITPTVVHAGGIHCRPAKPLPEELEMWIAGAGQPGFIYFSLGTLVKSSSMPEKYRKVMLAVFGSLQQRVLWKSDEDTIEGLPSNVRLSKWLPQQDILGHKQLRLFITHGGLFSTQEAAYHGIPVLGTPVSIDQYYNMQMVQQAGVGHFLYWENFTYENFRGHILQIMDDQRLQEKVQRHSRLMKDQPMSPKDWAAYWVEYVLQYKGATHLRSPALHIPWYQLYNVDVWALLVVATIITTALTSWVFYNAVVILIRCCYVSKKIKKE